jgi:hypothetical protein
VQTPIILKVLFPIPIPSSNGSDKLKFSLISGMYRVLAIESPMTASKSELLFKNCPLTDQEPTATDGLMPIIIACPSENCQWLLNRQ